MTTVELNGTRVTTIDEHDLTELPPAGHLMTVVIEIEPHNPGTPPHRHSGTPDRSTATWPRVR